MTLLYNFFSVLCNDVTFAMRENKETLFVHAQMKNILFVHATLVCRQNGPTSRNRLGAIQLDAAYWLVKLRPVGCGQLS